MERPTQKLMKENQEDYDYIIKLELIRQHVENMGIISLENESNTIDELINKMSLKVNETMKPEQDLLQGADIENNIANLLNRLRCHQEMKNRGMKDDKVYIKVNGFYHCPECLYKTKWGRKNLNLHINATHPKRRLWKCSDCPKGKLISTF